MYFSNLLLFAALTLLTFAKASPISIDLSGRNIESPVVRNAQDEGPDWKRDVEQRAQYPKRLATARLSLRVPAQKRETDADLDAVDWKRDTAAPPSYPPDWRRQPAEEAGGPLTGPDW